MKIFPEVVNAVEYGYEAVNSKLKAESGNLQSTDKDLNLGIERLQRYMEGLEDTK